MRLGWLAAGAALALATTAGCEKVPDNEVEAAAVGDTTTTLGRALATRDDLSTYRRLVAHAGLEGPLDGETEYTMLAPTDAAFAALPKGFLDALLSEEGKARAASLVMEQLVPGFVTVEDLTASAKANSGAARLTTMGGGTLVFRQTDAGLSLSVGDGVPVAVSSEAIRATNGAILPIDGLLIGE